MEKVLQLARMPNHRLVRIAKHLATGQSGWTIPDNLLVDESGHCYLSGHAEVFPGPRPERGATMFFRMIDDGVSVNVSGCVGHTWYKDTGDGLEMDYGLPNWLPVLELIGAE